MNLEGNNLSIEFVIKVLPDNFGRLAGTGGKMATFKDPVKCFAPLEVVERLLEIRSELGFTEVVYLDSSIDLAQFFDAFGFDVYALSCAGAKLNYGDYQTPIVPGGDAVHNSLTGH